MTELKNYLNKADFYLNSGIDSTEVNDTYVGRLIDSINSKLSRKLKYLFEPKRGYVKKVYRTNSNTVAIFNPFLKAGVVDSITLDNGGSGFTGTPTVTITGDGEDAEAEAVVSGGVVTEINILNEGSGYTVAPTVTISGGGGNGATATATISPSLDVKLGCDDNNTLVDLVEGDDYRLLYFDEDEYGVNFPIIGIKLKGYILKKSYYLQITGTTGYYPYIPLDLMLDIEFYDLIKKAVLSSEIETSTGGRGEVTQSKIDKVSVNFGSSNAIKYTFRQVLFEVDTRLDTIVSEYKFYPENLPTIIG